MMDVEDEGWVSVPYDGLLDVHDDGDEKIFSRKYVDCPSKFYEPSHFNTSQRSKNYVEDDLIFEKEFDHKEEIKEMIKLPVLIMEPKDTSCELETEPKSNKDPIFQIFFKKDQNQFVEMTVDSQESEYRTETGLFQCEEKKDDHVVNCSPSSSSKMIKKEVVAWKESNQRINFWKLGLNGIGVFCSLGITAATICIIIYGKGRIHKQQNQKLKFQIHPDNKRIKQVVQKANEAMSAVRGVPLANAKITYGGNYESI